MSARTVTAAARSGAGLRPRDALAVLLVAAAAWVALLVAARRPGGLDHHLLGEALAARDGGTGLRLLLPAGPGPVEAAALALTGWSLMVLAMMLPPALPLWTLLRGLTAGRASGTAGTGVLPAGAVAFVAVWLLVGAALLAADTVLHLVTVGHPWWAAHLGVVLGGALLLAGAYQFSPLKQSCLRACRSPRGFAVAHWRGRRPAWAESAVLAGHYGLSCVGCCWALMAVSFAVGTAALPAMVLLAVVTGAERLAPAGRRLTRPVGWLALVAGAALLAFSMLHT